MKSNGINENSYVAVPIKTPVVAVISILSLALIGSTWGRDLLENKKIKVTHILTNAKKITGSIKNVHIVKIDNNWNNAPAEKIKEIVKNGFAYTENFNNKIWMIAHSSGTTGTKKFMGMSYGNYWLRNNKAKLTHDFSPVITTNLFPVLSAPWVSYNLRTLFLNGTLVFNLNFLFLKSKNVQKIFGSPMQFSTFLKAQKNKHGKKIPIAHIAGASINADFAKIVFENFEIIHNFYGATEIGGISRKVLTTIPTKINSVGFLLPGNELKITDEDNNELPLNTEGIIQIKNNIILSSYIENKEASEQAFKSGWFIPGDIGFIDNDGEIFISGRRGDVLNINGVKIKAGIIEEKILLCPKVKESIVFISDENNSKKLSALIEVHQGTELDKCSEEIKMIIKNNFDKSRRLDSFYFTEKIPINENGKKMRFYSQDLLNNLIKIQV